MKKIIILGAVSAVTMAVGTTGFAACHFADSMRNTADHNRRAEAYTASDEFQEDYSCVFTDENQDGICDNCDGVHDEWMHEASHHNSVHHSERHGGGHHHR